MLKQRKLSQKLLPILQLQKLWLLLKL
jgi:hypothetical protein